MFPEKGKFPPSKNRDVNKSKLFSGVRPGPGSNLMIEANT